MYTVSAFNYENVWADRWKFGFYEVAVLFPRIVPCVEDFQSGDIDEEHACSEDVPSVVGNEGNTRTDGDELVGGDGNDGS